MCAARATQREEILDATVRVIVQEGLFALTLDAVAREAGVSKGGVLYHFRSKDLLVTGLIERCVLEFEQEIRTRCEQDPDVRKRGIRAFLSSVLAGIGFDQSGNCPAECMAQARQFHVAILAAAAMNPELLQPWRDLIGRLRELFQTDGEEPGEQYLTWLAADGLWFWEILGLLPEDETWRCHVVRTLKGRVAPQDASASAPAPHSGETNSTSDAP